MQRSLTGLMSRFGCWRDRENLQKEGSSDSSSLRSLHYRRTPISWPPPEPFLTYKTILRGNGAPCALGRWRLKRSACWIGGH